MNPISKDVLNNVIETINNIYEEVFESIEQKDIVFGFDKRMIDDKPNYIVGRYALLKNNTVRGNLGGSLKNNELTISFILSKRLRVKRGFDSSSSTVEIFSLADEVIDKLYSILPTLEGVSNVLISDGDFYPSAYGDEKIDYEVDLGVCYNFKVLVKYRSDIKN